MPPIVGEIVIERPVEAVFDVVADERNEPSAERERRQGVERTNRDWHSLARRSDKESPAGFR